MCAFTYMSCKSSNKKSEVGKNPEKKIAHPAFFLPRQMVEAENVRWKSHHKLRFQIEGRGS
jgi:hypothetical protein